MTHWKIAASDVLMMTNGGNDLNVSYSQNLLAKDTTHNRILFFLSNRDFFEIARNFTTY